MPIQDARLVTSVRAHRDVRMPVDTGEPGDLEALVALALPNASERTRGRLVAHADIRRFLPGMVAYRQAEARPFAVIVSGHAALRRTTPGGRQLVPRLAGRGRILGISGVIGHTANNGVVALTPLVLATWTPRFLRSLAEADPGLGLDLLEHTIEMTDELWEQLDALIYQDARARVARVLAVHGDLLFGASPTIPRGQLAELVGTSPEMTRRVLRSLEQDRILERVGNRGLRLIDPTALEAVSRRTI